MKTCLPGCSTNTVTCHGWSCVSEMVFSSRRGATSTKSQAEMGRTGWCNAAKPANSPLPPQLAGRGDRPQVAAHGPGQTYLTDQQLARPPHALWTDPKADG